MIKGTKITENTEQKILNIMQGNMIKLAHNKRQRYVVRSKADNTETVAFEQTIF